MTNVPTARGLLICLMAGWSASALADGEALTKEDCKTIIAQAVAAAQARDSDFRPDPLKTRMHIACEDRKGTLLGFYSMPDAWVGSVDIAKAKAYTAAAFSSHKNALSTRTIHCATQDGGPLWELGNANQAGPKNRFGITQRGIIQFPGGFPLYKGGKLVGAIGVSGDSVDADEDVAAAGAVGYEAPVAIRSNTVVGVAYDRFSYPGAACTAP